MADNEYTARVEPYIGEPGNNTIEVDGRLYFVKPTQASFGNGKLFTASKDIAKVGIERGVFPSDRPFTLKPLECLVDEIEIIEQKGD